MGDMVMSLLVQGAVALWKVLGDQIVALIVAAAAYAIGKLKKRIDLAALDASVEQEAKSQAAQARGEIKTPGSRKLSEAERAVIERLGSALLAHVVQRTGLAKVSIESVKPLADKITETVKRHSVLPLGPGDSGEHLIVIPRNDPPPIPRPSGEHESFGRIKIADVRGERDDDA